MHISLNGDIREFPSGLTVADLLRQLNIHGDQVAVECNMKILDRSGLGAHLLQEGDRIEIISFMGGGKPLRGGFSGHYIHEMESRL